MSQILFQIEPPVSPTNHKMSIHHLWGMGFRPFFMGGALYAVILMSVWLLLYTAGTMPTFPFPSSFWHGHEMIYGFSVAIVAGFLLTASANWTGTRGLNGPALMSLFLLWTAGRLVFLATIFNTELGIFAIGLDLLFLPTLTIALSPPLIRSKAFRNMIFIVLLSVLWIGNLSMSLAAIGWFDSSFLTRGLHLGLNLIITLIVVVGGRVVPFFTRNAISEANVRVSKFVENSTFLLMACYLVSDFLIPSQTTLTGSLAALLGVVSIFRLIGWQPHLTIRKPMVMILHLGYLWLCLGFLLIAVSDLSGLIPISSALHCLTVGAIGVFIIGMISRVSLGHTGRLLELKFGMLLSYAAINLAAASRISGLSLPAELYVSSLVISGSLWILSFLILLAYYTRIYLSPRADGRAG